MSDDLKRKKKSIFPEADLERWLSSLAQGIVSRLSPNKCVVFDQSNGFPKMKLLSLSASESYHTSISKGAIHPPAAQTW
jgi:hypothetical protein